MKNLFLNTLFLLILLSISVHSEWIEQSSGVNTPLYSVNAVNDYIVWVCGEGGKVLRTTNGGINWIQTSFPDTSLPLYNILGIGSNIALVTGSSSSRTFIYKTFDGGSTWSEKWSQAGGFINSMVRLENSQTIGGVGNPVDSFWTIIGSQDLGENWTDWYHWISQDNNETGWRNSVYMYQCDSWMGTNNWRLYNGSSCQPPSLYQQTPGLKNSMSIWGFQTTVLMAGGEALIKSTDGGFNWVTLNAPGTGNITGITCQDINTWIYVRANTIYHSLNTGGNWIVSYPPVSGMYTHLYKSPTSTRIWAIRNNGGIVKSDIITGAETESKKIPKYYKLYQNYPNPFNPEAKIKFDLPNSAYVQLTVFDILGREIELLVDEQLKPGSYDFDWNASNYPSGTYFYRLTYDNPDVSGHVYSETKKMILLK